MITNTTDEVYLFWRICIVQIVGSHANIIHYTILMTSTSSKILPSPNTATWQSARCCSIFTDIDIVMADPLALLLQLYVPVSPLDK